MARIMSSFVGRGQRKEALAALCDYRALRSIENDRRVTRCLCRLGSAEPKFCKQRSPQAKDGTSWRVMETVERYLTRKLAELQLLNACLETPKSFHAPTSVTEVIEQKFLIAAALKGEHARRDWAHTETAWTHREAMTAGPFRFSYDYQ